MKKLFCALACGIAFCSPVQAALVTFQFSAVIVRAVITDDPDDFDWNSATIEGLTFEAGNTVHGRVSYDTSLPVWQGKRSIPGQTSYKGTGGISLNVVENGFSFSSTSADIPQMHVSNDRPSSTSKIDGFGFVSHTTPRDVVTPLVASFSVVDYTGTAFDSTALPSDLDLSRFQDHELGLYYYNANGENWAQWAADITSLELVNEVPEPATLASLLTALALLIALGRHRARNTSVV